MTTSTSNKAGGTKKKSSNKPRPKPTPKSRTKAVLNKGATSKDSRTSNPSTPEDDDEGGSVGGTLDSDGDALMEEADKTGAGMMEIDDEGGEDDEAELSE
jgi:hypothetical protein